MHNYTKVLMRHQNIEEVMTMTMQIHYEDLLRTNDVRVFGSWNWFAARCGFGINKVIRFKYMYNVQDVQSDVEVEADTDEDSNDDSSEIDEYPCSIYVKETSRYWYGVMF